MLAIAALSLAGGVGALVLLRYGDGLLSGEKRRHGDWLTITYPAHLRGRIDAAIADITQARADLRDWFGTDIGALKVDIGDYPNPSFGIGYMRLPQGEVARGGRVHSIWHEIVHVAGAPGSLFGEGLAEDFENRFAFAGAATAGHRNIGRAVALFHRDGDYFLPSALLDEEIGGSDRLESEATRMREYATASAFATYVISVAFPQVPARETARHYMALARYDDLAPFRFPEAVLRRHLNGMTVAELEPGWYRHLRDRWNFRLPPKPGIAGQI